MLAHIHSFLQRFACKARPIFKGLATPGSASRTTPGPPRAQSPFARLRRYLFRRDVFCIPSEGVTPPSSLLRTHAPVQSHSLLLRLLASSMGLCRLSPVPAACWTFPVLSPLILPWVSGPVPRWVPVVLSPVSSHGNIGLLQALNGSTFPPRSRKAASHGASISGLQSFHYVQTPRFARHPGRSHHSSLSLGGCDFYIRASHDSLPYHAPDMLNVRIGQLTFGDFHPQNQRPYRLLIKLWKPSVFPYSAIATQSLGGEGGVRGRGFKESGAYFLFGLLQGNAHWTLADLYSSHYFSLGNINH
jgi:hypothetical protein